MHIKQNAPNTLLVNFLGADIPRFEMPETWLFEWVGPIEVIVESAALHEVTLVFEEGVLPDWSTPNPLCIDPQWPQDGFMFTSTIQVNLQDPEAPAFIPIDASAQEMLKAFRGQAVNVAVIPQRQFPKPLPWGTEEEIGH